MSEFEHVGKLIPGASGKKKTVRARVVDGTISSASSQKQYQPDVQSVEQPADKVILPFPRRQQKTANVQASLRPSPSPKGSPSVCPICKGAGFTRADVPYGHPDFGKPIACVCKERELSEKQQQKMIALSKQFGFQREKVLSTFRFQLKGVQEAFQEVEAMIGRLEAWGKRRDAAKQPENSPEPLQEWLVLLGPVGVGKTVER